MVVVTTERRQGMNHILWRAGVVVVVALRRYQAMIDTRMKSVV